MAKAAKSRNKKQMNAQSASGHRLLHNKHVAILGIAVIFAFALAALSLEVNTTGFVIANSNAVEQQILPLKVVDCDPANPLNIYERTLSNGDGTVDVYTFNACYPGCTSITKYEVKTRQ